MQKLVFVVSYDNQPLMPTRWSKAKRWIAQRKATPFLKKGLFCIRLNFEPTSRHTQDIVVGIDPGSKFEGFSVKSEAHTYLNIQTEAVTHVKEKEEVSASMRGARRFRKTPCRACRPNRSALKRKKGFLLPSIKARFQWKLRVVDWLRKILPVTHFAVEDVAAKTKPKKNKRWNLNFSPIEVGKIWFYAELSNRGELFTFKGFETAEMRKSYGLKKASKKSAERFSAHCVDSWCLANEVIGGHTKPDNESLMVLSSLRFARRQLQVLQPAKGGVRKRYGGTISEGFKRGSIVTHPKFGTSFVGGFDGKGRISLHSLDIGKRLTQSAKPAEVRFRAYNSWRFKWVA